MTTTDRRPRWAERTDQGFTLVELLTTMLLLGVVGGLVLTLVMTTYDSTTRDRIQGDNVNVASVGMNHMSRSIRAGTEIQRPGNTTLPIFVTTLPERMVLHSFTGDVPARVTYSVNANRELIEVREGADPASEPNWTFGAPSAPRVVARQIPVTATGQAPLFQYRDATGAALSLTATSDEASRRRVAAVAISLRVQTDVTARAIPAELINEVGLPNIAVVRR